MSTTVYQGDYKDGRSWVGLVRDVDKLYTRDRFAKKEEALAFAELGQARLDKEKEIARDPRASLPPSGDIDDERFSTTMKLFGRSDSCLDCHRGIMPTLSKFACGPKFMGDPKLGEFTRPWIKRYIATVRAQDTYRGAPYAWTTIHKHLTTIAVILKWRAEELRCDVPRFPLKEDMFPPGWEVKRDRRLEDGEHRALLRHFRQMQGPSRYHWRLLFQLAIETCSRQQELVGAEWDEFDPQLRHWDIPAERTKKSTARRMALTPRAKRIMRLLKLLAAPGNPRVFHVFSGPASVSALFHRASQEAGLVGFRYHDLRHEGISKFVVTQPNYKAEVIMKMVGHKDMETFQRYLNLRGDELANMMV